MPPAPLLDVVRHAARDDGVGDEVRARSLGPEPSLVVALLRSCDAAAADARRAAQGDEAPSLDAVLAPPASAVESALDTLATAAARLLLAGTAPETPPGRAEPLLLLAASPCGQARAPAVHPPRRDTRGCEPWHARVRSHALPVRNPGGGAAVRRRAAAVLRGGRLSHAGGGAAAAAAARRRHRLRKRRRRAALACAAAGVVAAAARGRPASAGARRRRHRAHRGRRGAPLSRPLCSPFLR